MMKTIDEIIDDRAAAIREWAKYEADKCDTDEAKARFLASAETIAAYLPTFGDEIAAKMDMKVHHYWRDHADMPAQGLYDMVLGWRKKKARDAKRR